ncbi:MAG: TolC family protein [Campylobacterota bacterium]|nr:TolC family protein [Campylobacterota bacterium]
MKNKILFSALCCLSISNSAIASQMLTISDAYKLGLENSNVMRSANYQLKANKEKVNQVKAEFYPQINGTVIHSKTDYEINKLIQTPEPKISETITEYKVTLTQPIYNPQTLAKVGIEKTRLKLFDIKVNIEKQELAKTVLKIYLDILKSTNRIALLDSYSDYYKYKLEAIQNRYKVNLSNKMDLLQSKLEYSTSKLELKKEKNLLKVYKLKLSNIIGKSDFILPTLNGAKLDTKIVDKIITIVKDKSDFNSNLEIQQALKGVEISKYDIKNSFAGHLPSVNLDGSYSKYDTDDKTVDYDNTKKIMLSVKIPIYQGGYTSSKIEASKLNLRAAKEDLIEIENDIKARYKEQMTLLNSAVESISLYKETLASSELYLESISVGYQNGLKSIIDLYDARNKLFDVKYQYIENSYIMMDSYIGLLTITNNFEQLKLLDEVLQ